MSAGVGADVEALCAKCGDVWHVVVAKVGAKIVKVQCKQCSGYHRYKSPHGAPEEKKLPATNRAPREASARQSPVARIEKPAVAADLTKPARPYRASENFDVGDRVDHPSFGQGIVELSEPGKLTVFFGTGRRLLAQAKEAVAPKAELSKPKPFDHSNRAGSKPIPGQ
jgi:hypothetical protein